MPPDIIAHRGVPAARPENTLASFAEALSQGADGIELDVHATADGVVVVHHDACLPGPDGPGSGPALAGTTLARLRAAAVHELPTLDDVLSLVGTAARVHVELKGHHVTGQALAVLARHPAESAVHAFDHRRIAHAATVAPERSRGLLLCSRVVHPVAVLRSASAHTIWQEWPQVDEQLIQEVHAAGGSVIAWTVNERRGRAATRGDGRGRPVHRSTGVAAPGPHGTGGLTRLASLRHCARAGRSAARALGSERHDTSARRRRRPEQRERCSTFATAHSVITAGG